MHLSSGLPLNSMASVKDRVVVGETGTYAVKHGIGKGGQGRVKLGVHCDIGQARN